MIESTQVNCKKMKKNWNDDERLMLIWIIGKYCGWKGIDYKSIVYDHPYNIRVIKIGVIWQP